VFFNFGYSRILLIKPLDQSIDRRGKIDRIVSDSLLHAYLIYFIHPTTKKQLYFKADFDEYMQNYIDKRFLNSNLAEVLSEDFIQKIF